MTRSIVTAVSLVLVVFAAGGCRPSGAKLRPEYLQWLRPENASRELREFVERLQQNGVITFSWEPGEPRCCDRDMALAFFPDDSVHLIHYGLGWHQWKGQYRIFADGSILLQFNGAPDRWRKLSLGLRRGAIPLLLQRQLPFSSPPAVLPDEDEDERFGPFHVLTAKAETSVLTELGLMPK
jgi:hypothetical protein